MKTPKPPRAPRSPSLAPRAPRLLNVPPGIPDARGWIAAPSTNKKRPIVTHFVRACIAGKWWQRSFRSAEEARAFCDAQNALNPALRAPATPSAARVEKLLTTDELAKRLRLTVCGLNSVRKRRGMPYLPVARNRFLYRWSEVEAWLETDRAAFVPAPEWWCVVPHSDRRNPALKFRAERLRNGKRDKKHFHSEAEANAFAAKANSALGRRAPGPVPECVRGMKLGGPLWRVRKPTRALELYETFAKVEGHRRSFAHPTMRAALEDANARNFAIVENGFADRTREAVSAAVESALAKAPRAAKSHFLALPTALTPSEPQTAFVRMASNPPFKIYPITPGTYPTTDCKFLVTGKVAGKEQRRFFHTEKEAATFAHMRNTEVQQQGIEVLTFPSWLRTMAQRCQHLLQEKGKNIEDATRHLLEYLARVEKSCSLAELIAKSVAAKRTQDVGKSYLQTLTRYWQGFAAFAGAAKPVSEITAEDINGYLDTFTHFNAVSRNGVRRAMHTLFVYGVEVLKVCAENPAVHSTFAKEIEVPVGIWTPGELAGLLAHAPEEWIPFLAIGAFAGLRSAELSRLDWKQVDLVDGYIEITAKNAKSATRRVVKILPALDAWIRPRAKFEGRIAPMVTFAPHKILGETMRLAGVASWPRNALRHSFASYHLAHFKDAAALALEMGHTTTELIFKHYRQVVRAGVAADFWRILPSASDAANVVPLARANAQP